MRPWPQQVGQDRHGGVMMTMTVGRVVGSVSQMRRKVGHESNVPAWGCGRLTFSMAGHACADFADVSLTVFVSGSCGVVVGSMIGLTCMYLSLSDT